MPSPFCDACLPSLRGRVLRSSSSRNCRTKPGFDYFFDLASRQCGPQQIATEVESSRSDWVSFAGIAKNG